MKMNQITNKITNPITSRIAPSATEMIRMDHTHVIGLFHRYKFDDDPQDKQANVAKNCMALEIHMQLEEEFFYPALRGVLGDNAILRKVVPEHDEMRHLIGKLRSTSPSDPSYDETYMHLLRNVMHHVADEESVLLSDAEHLMGARLHEIGAQMTRRRMQLMAQHAGHMVSDRVRQQPAKYMLIAAGAALAGTVLARRSWAHHPGRGRMAWDGSRFGEGRGILGDSMKSERASFKLGHVLGKWQGTGRGLLWRRRAESAARTQ